ncbi:MAG: CPBP family intramembrane metalloprotease [Planctomycetaceae bacterium]|jgi:membrane protease YdiL (CAAX protease family)|nr:CPBP family intramembrane metalloprotease [Planctomycetaceae bacterium]
MFLALSDSFLKTTLFGSICAGMTVGFLIFVILWLAKDTQKGYLCQVLLPFRHRPPVAWDAADVLLIIAFYFALQIGVSLILAVPQQENQNRIVQQSETNDGGEEMDAETGEEQLSKKQTISDKELRREHPLVVIMKKASSRSIAIIVCFLSAIIIAPLTEEFIFRVVIQSGIASTIRKMSDDLAVEKYLSILLPSLVFAAVHFRASPSDDANYPMTPSQVEQMIRIMEATALANLLTMGTAILFLRYVRGSKWSDLGLKDFRKTGKYALGALIVLLIILFPILLFFNAIKHLFPDVVVDPIPLFFFAVVLSTIYYRSRRFAVVFFLHAFFNAFSFFVLLFY